MKNYILLNQKEHDVLTGLLEDVINDGEYNTAWMDDQKAALESVLEKLMDM